MPSPLGTRGVWSWSRTHRAAQLPTPSSSPPQAVPLCRQLPSLIPVHHPLIFLIPTDATVNFFFFMILMIPNKTQIPTAYLLILLSVLPCSRRCPLGPPRNRGWARYASGMHWAFPAPSESTQCLQRRPRPHHCLLTRRWRPCFSAPANNLENMLSAAA